MQRLLLSVFFAMLLSSFPFAGASGAQEVGALFNLADGSSADYYQELIGVVTGNWREFGELFTHLQGSWFWKIFLAIITVVPGIFLLHYLIVGAKHFDHDGEQILFSLFLFVLFISSPRSVFPFSRSPDF